MGDKQKKQAVPGNHYKCHEENKTEGLESAQEGRDREEGGLLDTRSSSKASLRGLYLSGDIKEEAIWEMSDCPGRQTGEKAPG